MILVVLHDEVKEFHLQIRTMELLMIKKQMIRNLKM
jgi:hypothetical protein